MKTKRTSFWMTPVVILLVLVSLATGCKKDDYVEIPGVCPVVESTNPANGATNVPLNQIITVKFNVEMNPATITQASFTLSGGGNSVVPVNGALTYNNANATLSFVPTSPLVANTTYTGTVKSSVKDAKGNALQTNYVWTFSTGSILSPTVISTDPANDATGVFINKVVTATFSTPMDSLTINGSTFTIKQGTTAIQGVVAYSGTTASFTPTKELTPNTLYTGTITTGAKNKAGTPLETNYTWSFTTGTLSGPTVISTDPSNNATGVELDKTITATFSMAMDPLTLTSSTFTVKQGLNTVSGTVSYSGNTATFNPTESLTANVLYVATITTGAKNTDGIALSENYVWSFTTALADGPRVVSTDPADKATGVVLNKTVTATFNEVMLAGTLNTSTFTIYQGTTKIDGIISYSGKTVIFLPLGLYSPNTLYTATITTGAQNLAGTPMAADYIWTFTTGSVAAPTVISTIPINNATGVPLNQVVSANFSEPMNSSSINTTTFTLLQGSTPVEGNVSYSGITASFDPSVDLQPNTLYTATITNAVTNVGGVAMSYNYTWTFTTLSTEAPAVISTSPANNETAVALNKTVTAEFNMPMNPSTFTNSTFTLMDGSVTVDGEVTYTGTTASFNPTGDLLPTKTYTATITTGATNMAGTPLAADYIWSFTTLTSVTPPAIDLGTASIFGAFGGNAGITNEGVNTVINGAIATTAASTLVTGFHDGMTGDVYTETGSNIGLVTGGIFTAPPAPGTATTEAIATLALVDANAAYLSISPASMPGGIDPGDGELGGLTLAPGIYKSASGTFNISNGPLTLDAQGDPNATWVFQTAAGLTVGIAGPTGARSIVMTNGALPKNVFWYVGTAATINGAGGGIMVGTIMATSGVTFSTVGNAVQTVLNGRAISLVASVTMVNTTINVPE